MLLAAPLAVVGSSSDWWFLGSGPKRATPVAVLESGSWSGGQAWTLTAFRAENGGIRWSVDAGKASALGCAKSEGNPFLGMLRVIPQKPSVRWFAAVTKGSVRRVAVSFSNGAVVRSDTVAGPAGLRFGGRFFVIRQPDDPAILIDHVGGYARDGRLIACIDMQRLRIHADLAACMR